MYDVRSRRTFRYDRRYRTVHRKFLNEAVFEYCDMLFRHQPNKALSCRFGLVARILEGMVGSVRSLQLGILLKRR